MPISSKWQLRGLLIFAALAAIVFLGATLTKPDKRSEAQVDLVTVQAYNKACIEAIHAELDEAFKLQSKFFHEQIRFQTEHYFPSNRQVDMAEVRRVLDIGVLAERLPHMKVPQKCRRDP